MLAALGPALAATPGDAALMTPGDPTIVILDGRDVLYVVQLIGETHVRCTTLWDTDARLNQPTAVAAWLRRATGRA